MPRKATTGRAWLARIIAISLLCTAYAAARGEVQHNTSWPQTPPLPGAKTCGLHVVLSHRGVNGAGYLPVDIAVKNGTMMGPITPSPVERRFTINATISFFGANMHYASRAFPLRTPVEVVIPAGATEGKTTILVPGRGSMYMVDIDTYEDDTRIGELSGMNYVATQMQASETATRYLFIEDKYDDVATKLGGGPNVARFGQFAGVGMTLQQILGGVTSTAAPSYDLPQFYHLVGDPPLSRYMRGAPPGTTGAVANAIPNQNDYTTLAAMAAYENVSIQSSHDIPEKWLGLTCFDVICLSRTQWDVIVKDHPGLAGAIRDWTANGGRLVLHGVDLELDLAGLERSLALVPFGPTEESSTRLSRNWSVAIDATFAATADWEKAVAARISEKSEEENTLVWTRAREAFSKRLASDDSNSVRSAMDLAQVMSRSEHFRDPKHVVLVHRKGLGRVFVASHPKIDAEFAHAKALIDAQGKVDFLTRMGFSCETRNRDFWNFLIPGVGMQPVYSFLAMITLFVIAIGPLNYWLLYRANRLSLLLFTVPAGAAVLTAGLFTFATLSDGFGVKMRARSYTIVDQRAGQASVVARQSYYAGVAPSAGMTFDDQTFVYPIDYDPRQGFSRHELHWTDGQQRLRFGWLGSRSLRQFAVVRTTATSAGLEITENSDPPFATNRLGVRLRSLVMCDRRGELHYAENVAPGESIAWKKIADWVDPEMTKAVAKDSKADEDWSTRSGKKIDREKDEVASARSKLKRYLMSIYELTRPKYPENYDPDQHESLLSMRPSYGYYGEQVDVAAFGPQSLLEDGIDRATLRAMGSDVLPHRTYVAFAETTPHGETEGPLVPIGVPEVTEYGSFHVVRGTW